VAVNPADARYASVVSKHVILPLTGRRIPVIADEHADPELGSGCVKITPGHDFNDFEAGKRAGFAPAEMLNMLDGEANVCQTADGLVPTEFLGLHRFRKDGEDGARELVVKRMKELGLLIPHITKNKDGEDVAHDAEPRQIATPFGDRGGVVIEPWLTDQWYVNAAELAKKPIEAVRSGDIQIVPKTWEKTFFNWMENIQPWCVSRQLWWGHRIPAWFADDGRCFVAETAEAAQAMAGEGVALTQDEDVLDTWFSSALWPFATLGWPEGDAPLLNKHFPNSLLISGFDILFFWDTRMMMMGFYNMGERPWDTLYLHGLVRAADGAKMSKSKGNVVDPLGLIDQYGADALRFLMAAMESQGRDIKMDQSRVEGYRNFATKLWNAARFCQSNGIGASDTIKAPPARLAANQWIIGEVAACVAEIERAMDDLRFDAAANAIYQFTWSKFCDWYLELVKPTLQLRARANALLGDPVNETREVAGWALDQILVMLHPFMPFITEELWHKLGERPYELIVAQWPKPEAEISKEATDAINWVIDLTTSTRSAKNELGIAPGAKLAAWLARPSDVAARTIERSSAAIERLARLTPVTIGEPPAGPAMQVTAGEDVFVIPFEGIVDIAGEKARLEKALAASQKEAKGLEDRLSNPAFAEKAKPEAVEKARTDLAHHTGEVERLTAALARLG
jgi:valyl-tRNA synthetase